MTREELISRQSVLEIVERVLNKGDALFEIEQLQPVTLQSCNDCISRQETLKQINYWTIGSREHAYANTNYLIKRIQDMQPVMSQQKTGQWINGNPICPCCGENKFKDLDADVWSDWQPKFCPNCGAKMEVGK